MAGLSRAIGLPEVAASLESGNKFVHGSTIQSGDCHKLSQSFSWFVPSPSEADKRSHNNGEQIFNNWNHIIK